MACLHLTWGGYLCFATSFSSCAHIPKLEKCLVRPLGDHTHDFGGGLEFSYIIVLMVLYGPCCKSDSDHHCADSIYHHHYMELLHPFQNEKQEQDEEPLLVYFVILSARHFWMELVREHDNWGRRIFQNQGCRRCFNCLPKRGSLVL